MANVSINIPEEHKAFLERIMHEDAANNLSQAVSWCIDACIKIEERYKADACYIAYNDIRIDTKD